MQVFVQARWALLVAALVCGLITTLPWVYQPSMYWGVSFDWAFPGAAVLQALGAVGMSRARAKRLWVTVAFISAVAWAIAFVGAALGVAAGAGGLVYAFFVMLPANAVAILTQITALIGFAVAKRSGVH